MRVKQVLTYFATARTKNSQIIGEFSTQKSWKKSITHFLLNRNCVRIKTTVSQQCDAVMHFLFSSLSSELLLDTVCISLQIWNGFNESTLHKDHIYSVNMLRTFQIFNTSLN